MTTSNGFRRAVCSAALLVLAGIAPAEIAGQPMDERTPNLEGTWVAGPHELFFQFSHRFQVAGSDVDVSDVFGDGKVVNYPTFALNYGVFPGAMLGVRYSSNSLVAGTANEWQPFVKVVPLRGLAGDRLSVSALGAWNGANDSFDGELAARLETRPFTWIGAVRGYSSPLDRAPAEDESELALAVGAKLRLNEYLSLAADYANMVTQADAQIGWSAGVNLRIPYTPHTFGLYATNVSSGTLEGLSVGLDGATFWGFEFTIRFSGHRWSEVFDPRDRPAPGGGPTGEPAPQETAPDPETAADPSAATESSESRRAQTGGPAGAGNLVVVEIEGMAFQRAEITVEPGTTIRWVNRDPVPHTATSDAGAWDSSLLRPGESYQQTFRRPGRYTYHCAPHPFMTGVVTVVSTEGSEP